MQEPVNEQGTSSSVRTIVGSPQETGRMFGVSRGSAGAAQIGGVGGWGRFSTTVLIRCSLDPVRNSVSNALNMNFRVCKVQAQTLSMQKKKATSYL